MRPMTEEEFISWRDHPGTREIVRLLHAKREDLRQSWEGGAFTDYDAAKTALVNVGNLGMCRGYAFVTDLTYETYLMEVENGEHQRT